MTCESVHVISFLQYWLCYQNYVDLCGRRETPAGGRDRGDPAGALAPRRLPGPPAESEAPGAEINRLF
jgi:hypothetical protein